MEVLLNYSDDQLVSLYQENSDARVFSILVKRHEAGILRRCYSYVHDEDTAEDLCQEVLIKLFLRIKSFRNQAKFSTWLFSIVHNTCIDYLRKNKKNVKRVITKNLVNELPDLVEDEEDISRELSVKILDELLEQLSPDNKMILLMKYKEKHHIKDIQLTLGISESAIKMRLKRAKEKINKIYQRLS